MAWIRNHLVQNGLLRDSMGVRIDNIVNKYTFDVTSFIGVDAIVNTYAFAVTSLARVEVIINTYIFAVTLAPSTIS